MDYQLLNQLVRTPGVSGREERVRELFNAQLKQLEAETAIDAMGNLIGHIAGDGPRVALMAHMDEVGFLVSKIEPQGFVRVMPVGGVHPRVFGAQTVMVHGRKDLPGIVGSIPPHLLKNRGKGASKEAIAIEDSFIDLGLPAREVAAQVRIGDPVTFATPGWENDTSFFAKALDDRLGIYVMLEAVAQVSKIDCDLFLIGTTQEEFGLRGAGPAVFGVAPEIAIALEGAPASDTPGLKLPDNATTTRQGGGPEVRLTDGRMISNHALAGALIAMAGKAGIPCQAIVKNTGGTDAAAGQVAAGGSKVCSVSVPVRYIHAPIAMARKSDIKHTIRLVAEFLAQVSELSL